MKNKVALVIPYFGTIPDYFDLWALSAGLNTDFDFLIFSDLDFPVENYKNIKHIPMTFKELQTLIFEKINVKTRLDGPYKLCDFKPLYGLIFSKYLKNYDFWGFCDIDVIFGNISYFITDSILQKYNKILTQGHFCLLRNDEKMNYLFMEKFPHVIDYRFALNTRYSCHFDENGTIAYADEYDPSVKLFFDWIFFDVDFNEYLIKIYDSECCFVWDKGILTVYWNHGNNSEEVMYVHLQKRKMNRTFKGLRYRYGIFRDEFIECENTTVPNILDTPLDTEKKMLFDELKKQRNRQIKIRKIKTGWIKIFVARKLLRWRMSRKYPVTKEERLR